MPVLCGIVAFGLLCWLFPPFRIVPLKQAQAEAKLAVFDAPAFAANFWTNRLIPALGRAADATRVLDALARDPRHAREQFGRSVGLSSSCYFFLRGAGTVVSAGAKGVGLALTNSAPEPDVRLLTGLLFGNAVRDATGLLDPGQFANSQHFNDLATELNRIVETRVLPQLREQALPGRRLRFVGCVELDEGAEVSRPLAIVPVQVSVELQAAGPTHE